ncbi:hypothetical protein DXG01_003975 [Tephrocybe rancida]|nr:hypothetical protein DXG01_003975 [Tephrocybe rancida]
MNLDLLPSETISRILSFLNLADLSSAILTHSRLYASYKEFPQLKLQFAAEAAGVTINPSAPLELSQLLELLRSREEGWLTGSFAFQKTIQLPAAPPASYDMGDGFFITASDDLRDLDCLRLPTSASEPLTWRKINLDGTYAGCRVSLRERDLIIVLLREPHTTEPDMWVMTCTPLQFSTGLPHPAAFEPRFLVEVMNTRARARCIAVAGNNVGILLCDLEDDACEKCCVFDWTTGRQQFSIGGFHRGLRTYLSFTFLTPTLLLLPKATGGLGTIDIWPIPSDIAAMGTPAVRLHLPILADNAFLWRIDCDAAPSPDLTEYPPHDEFTSISDKAIVIFNIYITRSTGSDTFKLVVHRDTLVSVVQSALDNNVSDVQWSNWGPNRATLLPVDVSALVLHSSAGQRCTLVKVDLNAQTQELAVLDFNPVTVRRLSRQFEVGRRQEAGTLAHVVTEPQPYRHVMFRDRVECKLPYVHITFPWNNEYLGRFWDIWIDDYSTLSTISLYSLLIETIARILSFLTLADLPSAIRTHSLLYASYKTPPQLQLQFAAEAAGATINSSIRLFLMTYCSSSS